MLKYSIDEQIIDHRYPDWLKELLPRGHEALQLFEPVLHDDNLRG